jgi:hypothetical protein
MKSSVFFFAFAFAWHSVHGQEYKSSFLLGSDIEAAMAKDAKPATSGGDSPFHERHLHRLPTTNSTCATTSVVRVMHPQNKTSTVLLTCDTANGKHYFVHGVPDHVIQANKKGIIDGTVELIMPEGAYLDEDSATLEMPRPERLKFKRKITKDGKNSKEGLLFDRSRCSLAVTGTCSALAVCVIASGVATLESEATLSNAVFGNGADGTINPVTMKSHFQTCSFGQLNFVPANDRDGRSIRI